jgi:ATP-dependent Clp protease ATP-binding subunit ClpB
MTAASKPQSEIHNEVMSVVGRHFRPEFINRIDETVVFDPLSREQIRGIASIQLDQLRKRLAEKDLDMVLKDEVMDKLSEAGFDPIFGARPLKRTIQQLLENPLSQRLLSGDFVAGDTIKVSLDDLGHLVFQK